MKDPNKSRTWETKISWNKLQCHITTVTIYVKLTQTLFRHIFNVWKDAYSVIIVKKGISIFWMLLTKQCFSFSNVGIDQTILMWNKLHATLKSKEMLFQNWYNYHNLNQ